ncbi:MAG: electron transfer flavoprotein subunit alpha/FixB family protein [Deltaproteobacteria bacterium]|nr:electron transfer flavoprotein subunit alpha/FixB family protein [Deltaproteobacteria bacterium]
MAKNICTIAEQRNGELRKITYETVSEARRLADRTGGSVTTILLGGPGIGSKAAGLGAYGADAVIVAEDEALSKYTTDAYCQVIAALVKEKSPSILIMGASSEGKDLSSRLAAALDAGLAMDCTALDLDDNQNLVATRPMYAGKVFAETKFADGCLQMATTRPNVISVAEPDQSRSAAVEKTPVSLDAGSLKTELLDVMADTSGKADLTEAEIIVSGGRGMKDGENFRILEELADVLGATVGASRSAVDAGWRPHRDQVGQTGKVVTPNLYIACGISGSIQHLAGMASSKVIVAINKDPDAPIFQKADYGIVGDLFDYVPVLTEEFKKIKSE